MSMKNTTQGQPVASYLIEWFRGICRCRSWGIAAQPFLSHWGRVIMAAILQTIFWNAFSWKKKYQYRLKFHWNWFLGVQLTIFQHWFRWWLGTDQWWLVYWRTYASLGLSDLNPCTIQTFMSVWIVQACQFLNIWHTNYIPNYIPWYWRW